MLSERESIADLCSAIILQAVDDYRDLSKKIRSKKYAGKRALLERDLRSVESFFRSDWFRMISNLDGAAILRELRSKPRASVAV